ncbi:TetR/AcrR family transcriptional regulator C-terminal domain-containing protein [Luteococcus sediminum]
MALTREQVVDQAVEILDSYGMADLSMRRLGDALGVKAGALYWHVANKQSLLAAVADRILSQVVGQQMATADPAAALLLWGGGLRRVLLAHRDSAELVATALASGLCEKDPIEDPRRWLVEAGLDQQRAGWAAQAVLHLVLGHVSEEQNILVMKQLGLLPGGASGSEGFDFALRCLLEGIVRQLP